MWHKGWRGNWTSVIDGQCGLGVSEAIGLRGLTGNMAWGMAGQLDLGG
jgi:hypothetical protein